MKLPLRPTLLLGAALAAATALSAQTEPTVRFRLEPDSIQIGDRFTYTIEVDRDLVQAVAFPELGTDSESGIELVESLPVDTLSREGRRLTLRKRYVMAAFEEGRIRMGRGEVLYADKNILDTLRSDDDLELYVATFAIDSTSHTIHDLKAQKTLPFRFGEISGYFWWGLLTLALLGGALYLFMRWLAHRGRSLRHPFRPAPELPPHVVAIRALEALHNQKLWQNNRHKAFYSGLTDILRNYIAARFGIGAMEMTSDEIIDALRNFDLPAKSAFDLQTVLRDADLVKFAKATPEGEQNEADYLKAYYFVEETKIQEPAASDEQDILDRQINPSDHA